MDGNIKDTPPVILVPAPGDRAHYELATKELAEVRKQAEARKTSARADYDKWLTTATPEHMATYVPSAGLLMHAQLSEGEGKTVNVTVDGKSRAISLASGFTWGPGHVAAKAFKSLPGAAVEVAEGGALAAAVRRSASRSVSDSARRSRDTYTCMAVCELAGGWLSQTDSASRSSEREG